MRRITFITLLSILIFKVGVSQKIELTEPQENFVLSIEILNIDDIIYTSCFNYDSIPKCEQFLKIKPVVDSVIYYRDTSLVKNSLKFKQELNSVLIPKSLISEIKFGEKNIVICGNSINENELVVCDVINYMVVSEIKIVDKRSIYITGLIEHSFKQSKKMKRLKRKIDCIILPVDNW